MPELPQSIEALPVWRSALSCFIQNILLLVLASLPWAAFVRRKIGIRRWLDALALGGMWALSIFVLIAQLMSLVGWGSRNHAWLGWIFVSALPWVLKYRYRSVRRSCQSAVSLQGWGALLAIAIGLSVRLPDVLLYLSPAGSDVLIFQSAASHFVEQQTAIFYYPAGLSIAAAGLCPFGDPSRAVAAFIPSLYVLAVLCILAGFRRSVGFTSSSISAVLFGGFYGFRHVLIYPSIFPQFAGVLVALPWLMRGVSLWEKKALRSTGILIVASGFLFLALFSTYFAFIMAAVIGVAGLITSLLTRQIRLLRWFALAALPVPLYIAIYFGVMLPSAAPETGLNIVVQSETFMQREEAKFATWELPAPLRSLLGFIWPKRLQVFRPNLAENAFMFAGLALGLWLAMSRWRGRLPNISRILHGLCLILLVLSAWTGILEMPGYQGRAIYILFCLIIPLLCRRGMLLVRCILNYSFKSHSVVSHHLRSIVLWGGTISCVPVILSPPIAGRDVVPSGARVRKVPEDECVARWLMAEPLSCASIIAIYDRKEVSALSFKERGLWRDYLIARFGSNRLVQITSVGNQDYVHEPSVAVLRIDEECQELSTVPDRDCLSCGTLRICADRTATPRY